MKDNAPHSSVRYYLAEGLGVEDIALKMHVAPCRVRRTIRDFRRMGVLEMLYRNARQRVL